MSDRAAIRSLGSPGYLRIYRGVALDVETGGYPLRPARPAKRDPDMGGGPPHRGPGRGPGHRVAVWYRGVAIGLSAIGVPAAAILIHAWRG